MTAGVDQRIQMEATVQSPSSHPRAPSPKLKASRRAVLTLFFLNGALFATWAARVPAIKETHHLSDGALGLTLLAIALGAVTSMPLSGWLCARIGSENVCKLSALCYCLLLPALALAPSVAALAALLFCFGVAHAALDVAMNAQAVEVEKAYQQPIMSSFHALWSTGGLAGAALGGILAGQGMKLLPHFALASFVFASVAALSVGRLFKHEAARVPRVAPPMFQWPGPQLLVLGIIALCVMMGEGAMADWSAVYLRTNLAANETVAAWGFAAFSLAMAAGRYGGDWLCSRLGPAVLVRAGSAIAAAGTGLAMLAPRPWLALAGFAMVGLGFATSVPMVFSAAGRKPGIAAGVAIAAVSTLGYLGFLIGPPLIGLAAQWLGLRTALGIIVATSLMAALLAGLKAGLPRGKMPPPKSS